MGGERLSPPVYKVTYTPEGVQMTTVTRQVESKYATLQPEARTTEGHESHHSVIAVKLGIRVKRASIVPGPGFLGVTEVDSYHPAIAAAAHAHGADPVGTGQDRYSIQWHGDDESAASHTAQSIAAEGNTPTQIAAVSEELGKHGTLYGADIVRIMREVDEDADAVAKGVQVVDIFVKTPEGDSKSITGLEISKGEQLPIDLVEGVETTVAKPSRSRFALAG